MVQYLHFRILKFPLATWPFSTSNRNIPIRCLIYTPKPSSLVGEKYPLKSCIEQWIFQPASWILAMLSDCSPIIFIPMCSIFYLRKFPPNTELRAITPDAGQCEVGKTCWLMIKKGFYYPISWGIFLNPTNGGSTSHHRFHYENDNDHPWRLDDLVHDKTETCIGKSLLNISKHVKKPLVRDLRFTRDDTFLGANGSLGDPSGYAIPRWAISSLWPFLQTWQWPPRALEARHTYNAKPWKPFGVFGFTAVGRGEVGCLVTNH